MVRPIEVAIVLFDGVTALDAVGPYEVLSRLPAARVRFVGARRGVVETADRVLGLRAADATIDVGAPSIVVVPGGPGARRALRDAGLLTWLRATHVTAHWTTSVCTGSLILGAAGLLHGVRATTHWAALGELAEFGAIPVRERVVFDRRIVTGAGVSAGIDFALALAARIAGPDAARGIQLALEYAPDPPFDAGSPDTAPREVVAQYLAARARRART